MNDDSDAGALSGSAVRHWLVRSTKEDFRVEDFGRKSDFKLRLGNCFRLVKVKIMGFSRTSMISSRSHTLCKKMSRKFRNIRRPICRKR